MNKKLIGLILGIAAGIIDVIPMIINNLPLSADLSAFTMWVVVGFFIATVELKMNPILKGIFVSFLTLSPVAIIIAWEEPLSLIPITIMTTILGGLLGFSINRFKKPLEI